MMSQLFRFISGPGLILLVGLSLYLSLSVRIDATRERLERLQAERQRQIDELHRDVRELQGRP